MENNKRVFVLGFLFSTDKNYLSLIKKGINKRFPWMEGLYNGVGGLVEEGEEHDVAMRREFLEETGVDIWGWEKYCTLVIGDDMVIVYRAFNDLVTDTKTITDEEVRIDKVLEWLETDPSHYGKLIYNLYWLIPLALDTQVKSSTFISK